jgi:ABC-type multidrug transport system ATPase subunit
MGDDAIQLVGLTKTFGPKTAVDKVTLAVPTGSVFGLIGPNGAGKTTTFSMMAGYLRPTEGSVRVLNLVPTDVDKLRSRLGVLPQDAILPPTDKVGEFLLHMARLQDLPGDKALAAARGALDEVAGADWWNQRCGSLSHGMAKRVALAQAFLGEPEVVLLDEPTAGLDPRVAFEMRQLIKAKTGARGARRTIVISSHNLQELEEICDGAAILDRGRLVTSGVMAELTAANAEVRIQVAPGTRRGSERGQVPLAPIRDLATVAAVDFDDDRSELVIALKRDGKGSENADPETVIGQVLAILLKSEVGIRGVVKGRGLEQRVMDLT